MKGGGREPGQIATLPATDPDAALITHGGIADAGVVVTGGLLVTKAHCHGEITVGQLDAANRGGAGGEQATDPEISFRVAGTGGHAIEGDGFLQMTVLLGNLTLLDRRQRLGGLSEIPALCHRPRRTCQ